MYFRANSMPNWSFADKNIAFLNKKSNKSKNGRIPVPPVKIINFPSLFTSKLSPSPKGPYNAYSLFVCYSRY